MKEPNHNYRTLWTVVFLGTMFGLLSCNLLQGALTAAPEQIEVATAAPPATSAPVATQAPAPDVDFEGISFRYDPSLTENVVASIVAAEGVASDPIWMIFPEHAHFIFMGYQHGEAFHTAQIFVYPVDEFEARNEYVGDIFDQLRQFLEDQPSTAPDGIPFLPFWNAAQMTTSSLRYLNFENGSGVRFLTQYGQALWPIDNINLFYTFQGMTDDSSHYVAAIFPVTNPILPDDGAELIDPDFEAFVDNWDSYLTDIVSQLSAQGMSTFSPDLSLLDALIQSLHID
jgi:hypothetical protein